MKRYLLFALLMTSSAQAINFNIITNPRGTNYVNRLTSALQLCLNQAGYDIFVEHNGDDTNVAMCAGSFSKALEHDATTGLLTTVGVANYQQLLTALNSGLQVDFNAIVRSAEATRKFVNPQSAYALSLVGTPGMILPMPSAPTLTSADAAADMIEVYLKMICRNVRFEDYGTGAGTDVDTINGGSLTNNAAAVLTALGSAYKGPSTGGTVTAAQLFRGTSAGDLTGPYISQFWWLTLHRIFQPDLEQVQYVPVAQAREFGVSFEDCVSIQNGAVPKPYQGSDFSGQRYVITGRDGGTAVHNDGPGDFFINVINILLSNGAPLAPESPYLNGSSTNEEGFVTFMIADMYNVLLGVMQEALKNAWAHKWLANRKLRPEAMAGLVHRAKVTGVNQFNLDSSLFTPQAGIDVLATVSTLNQLQAASYPGQAVDTYLLALLFPEGSPVHPAYPAGHAVLVGACETVLKAFFDDTVLLNTFVAPVKPDPADPTTLVALTNPEGANLLTIAGELDKLASNVALSRNFAGVHYRSDGDEGIVLGEQVALKYLQDHARICHETGFTGYVLTKRNGERVRITPEAITVIV